MPAPTGARDPGRASSARAGGTSSSSSTTCRRRRPRSARCTKAVWRDGRRSPSRSSTPGGRGPAQRPQPALPRRPGRRGVGARHRRSSRSWTSSRRRMTEELDYHLEARHQRAVRRRRSAATRDVLVPDMSSTRDHVSSRSGSTARRCPGSSPSGTQEQRDVAAQLLPRVPAAGPGRAGLLHADPHPGNFRVTDDGRLGVLDFGAVNRLPNGLPPAMGRVLTEALAGEARRARRAAREGFIRKGVDRRRPRAAARLPHPARGAAARGGVHLLARVAARRRGAHPGPAAPQYLVGLQAQPAPGVPPDPPGLARRHRGALPDRWHGAAARAGLRAPARHGRVPRCRRPGAGDAVTTRPSRACPRCCAGGWRLQMSQVQTSRPFSTPRAQVIRQGRRVVIRGASRRTSRRPACSDAVARHPRAVAAFCSFVDAPWRPS